MRQRCSDITTPFSDLYVSVNHQKDVTIGDVTIPLASLAYLGKTKIKLPFCLTANVEGVTTSSGVISFSLEYTFPAHWTLLHSGRAALLCGRRNEGRDMFALALSERTSSLEDVMKIFPRWSTEAATKQGMLGKKKKNTNNTYQQRWFSLKDDHFYYFKDADEPEPRGAVPLMDCYLEESIETNEYEFAVQTSKRKFTFKAASFKEKREWLEALRAAIDGSTVEHARRMSLNLNPFISQFVEELCSGKSTSTTTAAAGADAEEIEGEGDSDPALLAEDVTVLMDNKAQDLFRSLFAYLESEVPLLLWQCQHKNSGVSGSLYLTRNHLCFYGKSLIGRVDKEVISLGDVTGLELLKSKGIEITTHELRSTYLKFKAPQAVYAVLLDGWKIALDESPPSLKTLRPTAFAATFSECQKYGAIEREEGGSGNGSASGGQVLEERHLTLNGTFLYLFDSIASVEPKVAMELTAGETLIYLVDYDDHPHCFFVGIPGETGLVLLTETSLSCKEWIHAILEQCGIEDGYASASRIPIEEARRLQVEKEKMSGAEDESADNFHVRFPEVPWTESLICRLPCTMYKTGILSSLWITSSRLCVSSLKNAQKDTLSWTDVKNIRRHPSVSDCVEVENVDGDWFQYSGLKAADDVLVGLTDIWCLALGMDAPSVGTDQPSYRGLLGHGPTKVGSLLREELGGLHLGLIKNRKPRSCILYEGILYIFASPASFRPLSSFVCANYSITLGSTDSKDGVQIVLSEGGKEKDKDKDTERDSNSTGGESESPSKKKATCILYALSQHEAEQWIAFLTGRVRATHSSSLYAGGRGLARTGSAKKLTSVYNTRKTVAEERPSDFQIAMRGGSDPLTPPGPLHRASTPSKRPSSRPSAKSSTAADENDINSLHVHLLSDIDVHYETDVEDLQMLNDPAEKEQGKKCCIIQ